MNRKIKQGYRVISAVLIFVLCVNTLFTASIPTYAAETVPGIETNAVHTYNNTSVTEGVIYETAPESGKVWGNSPLVESSQPKTMAAPMSTPSGVVKPSDKANDSSSHDGMYADTGSNHIDGVGGHYEYQDVWVVDRIETLTKTIPAVYETRVGYIPARTETRYEIIPEWFEKVEIPKKTEIKRVWVPEKVTFLTKTIPAKTGKRTITVKAGYWLRGTKTIPGYWKYGSKLIPGKTVRTKVKRGNRYVWKTTKIPPRTVKTKTWVAPRTIPNNTWIPPRTRQETYVIEPEKKVTERVVLKEGFYRNVEVTVQKAETKYIHHDEVKRPYQVQIPPEKVETKVLVKEAYQVTEEKEIGHFKKVKVWVADPVNTGGTSGSSGDSGNSNDGETSTSEETNTEEIDRSESETSNESLVEGTNRSKEWFTDKLASKLLENEKISTFVEKRLENKFVRDNTERSKEVRDNLRGIYLKIEEAMKTPIGQSVMNGIQVGAGALMILVPMGLTALSGGLAAPIAVPLIAVGSAMVMEGTIDQIELMAKKDLVEESNPGRLTTGTIGAIAGKAFGEEEIGRAVGESFYDALEVVGEGYMLYLVAGGGKKKPGSSTVAGTDDIIASTGDDVVASGADDVVASGADDVVASGADDVVASGADDVVTSGADDITAAGDDIVNATDSAAEVATETKYVKSREILDELPENVQDAYKKYDDAGWQGTVPDQTPGTKAGKTWRNDLDQLPSVDGTGNSITYKEFDVNNKIEGLSRDAERLIIGSNGSIYYTDDHYKTFIEIIQEVLD